MAEQANTSLGVQWLFSALGAVVLFFILGAYSAEFDVFPYPQILETPLEKLTPTSSGFHQTGASSFPNRNWVPTRYDQFGALRYDPESSSGGPIFYTSGHKPSAVLVSRRGDLLHKWERPFSRVWPDPEHVDVSPKADIYWQHAHLLPNGHIIAVYTATGKTIPYGYGLVRLDRDSNLVWKQAINAHGNFGVRRDGDVFVLTHGIRNLKADPVGNFDQFTAGTILEDFLVHVSADGEIVDKVSLLEAFLNSDYRDALSMFPTTLEKPAEQSWDPLHPNDIDVIGSDFASKLPFARQGQLLVSFRTLDAVGILDLQAERLTWLTRGSWWQQYDADPLPNGNLMVFDSNGHHDTDGPSRILEFRPKTGAIEWSYQGTPDESFWSIGGGTQQVLENGNLLVTSTSAGRIFEVTREGQIVWEFRNPVHGKRGKIRVIATVQGARRASPHIVDHFTD